MYIFWTFEQIQKFAIFSSIDFTIFSQFEILATTILVNLFYLGFLSFVFSVVYKTFNRLLRILF